MKPGTAKSKGRETENRFVDYARTTWGLAGVERRRLAGINDMGDIAGWPGVCVEIKSGAKVTISTWLAELATETANSHATIGFCAVRPKGQPDPTDWYAILPLPALMQLMAEAGWMPEQRQTA